MDRRDRLFEQFLRERTYVNNVTASTREWHECAWKAFNRAQQGADQRATSAALISRADLQHFVVHLRERGLRPVTCNNWVARFRPMKYLHLLTEDLQRPHQGLSILNRLR